MDNAIPAHAIAEALRQPCHSHQGNAVPSLILRLEPLPEATARHERERSLAAAPDQQAEPEAPAEAVQTEVTETAPAQTLDGDGSPARGTGSITMRTMPIATIGRQ